MAFTKAPEYNTHQTEIVPVGGMAKTYPLIGDAGVDFTLKNLVLQRNEKNIWAIPIPPAVASPSATAALNTHYAGIVYTRGVYYPKHAGFASWNVAVAAEVYVVVDNDLWAYTPGGPMTLLASNQFTSTSTDIGWTDYVVGSTKYTISNEVLSGGTSNTLRFYDTTGTLPFTVNLSLSPEGLPDIVFLDGYLFLLGGTNGQRIYNSTLGTPTTWNTSTDFLDAESFGDSVVGMMRHHNHLVVWGTHSMEFFYNSGNELGSPLSRQANYVQSIGGFFDFSHRTSKCAINDTIYFAGGRGGHYLGIYRLSQFKVEKISPDWLDEACTRGTTASGLERNYGYAPTIRPFKFGTKDGILVTAGNASSTLNEAYFYDPSTGMWSIITQLGDYRNYVIGDTPLGTILMPGQLDIDNVSANHLYVIANNFYGDLGEFNDPPGEITQNSAWKTESLTFNVPHDKHIYSVEVIGSFPYNTLNLYVEEDDMHTESINRLYLGSRTQDKKTYHQNPMIWRNIGRFRSPRFTLEISGQNSFRLGGMVVKFNQGTR